MKFLHYIYGLSGLLAGVEDLSKGILKAGIDGPPF